MKSTAAETETRILKVAEWLVDGWSRAKICENARKTEGWEVSDSQIDRYIAKARERIRDGFKDDWLTNRAMANARLESLYSAAIDKGDLRLALSIVKEQAALQKPENSGIVYANNEDFMTCLYAYAGALNRIVPEHLMIQVNEAVRELAPVAESLEATRYEYDPDECMQAAVRDYETLGRTRTREELIEDGFFEGLSLPG